MRGHVNNKRLTSLILNAVDNNLVQNKLKIRGQFPYLRVFCPLVRDEVQDEAGHVKEKIYTYTMQAEPAFLGQSMSSMKLDVEVSDEVTCTYILKFLDKDVEIVNGRLVE